MSFHQPDGWAQVVVGHQRDPQKEHQLDIVLMRGARGSDYLAVRCNCLWEVPFHNMTHARAVFAKHLAESYAS